MMPYEVLQGLLLSVMVIGWNGYALYVMNTERLSLGHLRILVWMTGLNLVVAAAALIVPLFTA